MKQKLTLVLEVEYEIQNAAQTAFLEHNLRNLVTHGMGEGMLTGESDAEVECYTCDVVASPTISVLESPARRDLVKLLDYCQEAEEKHYEEGKADLGAGHPASKKHIWHTIKRLAKHIDHEV